MYDASDKLYAAFPYNEMTSRRLQCQRDKVESTEWVHGWRYVPFRIFWIITGKLLCLCFSKVIFRSMTQRTKFWNSSKNLTHVTLGDIFVFYLRVGNRNNIQTLSTYCTHVYVDFANVYFSVRYVNVIVASLGIDH